MPPKDGGHVSSASFHPISLSLAGSLSLALSLSQPGFVRRAARLVGVTLHCHGAPVLREQASRVGGGGGGGGWTSSALLARYVAYCFRYQPSPDYSKDIYTYVYISIYYIF